MATATPYRTSDIAQYLDAIVLGGEDPSEAADLLADVPEPQRGKLQAIGRELATVMAD